MTPHAGLVLAGKYRLEAPLARGGMGSVWAARHVTLGSPVAIKFLGEHLAGDATSVSRFEREARAAALLQSPHVVQVQDYGVEGGTPYIVMERLEGEDLNQRLRRVKRISIPEMHRILVQVGRALRRAHDMGIIHRDLKPANLFLSRPEHDGDEVLKILDFGIAKQLHTVGEATGTAEIVGSPHYMSPEHARSNKIVDHRTDLWAMGVITYRALTGELPFPGDILAEILTKVLVDPPPPVHTHVPDLPPALDAFFARALAKPRDERFQSVHEMVEAFGAVVGAAPPMRSLPSLPMIHVEPTPVPFSEPALFRTPETPALPHPSNPTVPVSQSGFVYQSAPSTEANATMDVLGRTRPRVWLWGGLGVAALLGVAVGLLAWSGGRPDPTHPATTAEISAPAEPVRSALPEPTVAPAPTPAVPTSTTSASVNAASPAPTAAPRPSHTGAGPAAGPTTTKTTKTRPSGPATSKTTPGWGF